MSPRTRKKKCKELKRNIIETQSQNDSIQIKNKKNDLRKKKYQKNPLPERDTKKRNIEKILNKKRQKAVLKAVFCQRLRRIFSAVYYVKTNPPEERVQVLLSENELKK